MNISELKTLVASKLVFDVQQGAPSQACIDERLSYVTPKRIRNVSIACDAANLATALTAVVSVTATVFFMMGILSTKLHTQNTPMELWVGFFCSLAGILVSRSIYCFKNALNDIETALLNELGNLQPLPQAQCAVMLKQCQQTPEGMSYREGVIAAGRQFVIAEKTLLKNWNESASDRAACSELYNLNED
ncbi:LysR family transcriptional regulator [Novimethylophilus kurashikiensis]|uniref:LysR family transcriptional regulator n=1 Tax=Novimethylophilus kurashikiensis TaxID=1825523 RepID=A0A2R5F954_9PROT|nr:hypothetical protein [Novimethylophilus kurashikiensis]GBG14565.1 LysR family transcriptional regulator [Novimethylophilus kurashikiensis]